MNNEKLIKKEVTAVCDQGYKRGYTGTGLYRQFQQAFADHAWKTAPLPTKID